MSESKEKESAPKERATTSTSKPIRSWREIFEQEQNEENTSSKLSRSSEAPILQDAQDPDELSPEVKKWIESLSQSP